MGYELYSGSNRCIPAGVSLQGITLGERTGLYKDDVVARIVRPAIY